MRAACYVAFDKLRPRITQHASRNGLMQNADLTIFARQCFGVESDAEAGAGGGVHPAIFNDKGVIDQIEVEA